MFYEIGNRIRTARKTIGMTQAEFAKEIGCGAKTLSNWECGAYPPKGKKLEKISALTGLDVRYFTHGENRKRQNPYWERISKLADKQRSKGLLTYKQGLEDNPAAMRQRIEHLQEELIDALMYCEWIKDKLNGLGEKEDGSQASSAHV